MREERETDAMPAIEEQAHIEDHCDPHTGERGVECVRERRDRERHTHTDDRDRDRSKFWE